MKRINILDIIEYAMVDLHLHFDGAISVNIIEELIKLQPHKKLHNWDMLTEKEKKQLLSVTQDCNSLNEYLKKFDYPETLLQTPDAVRLAIKLLVKDLEKQGYIYADIRFAPQLFSTELRDSFGEDITEKEERKLFWHEVEIVRAVLEGICEADLKNMEANIILCCMRNKNWGSNIINNYNANRRTIKIAKMFDIYHEEHKLEGRPRVIALDLAGGEADNKNEDYIDLYRTYKSLNFKNVGLTIHSGEAGTLKERLDNLSMVINQTNANIGHGVTLGMIYDESIKEEYKKEILCLMNKLASTNRILEICITSNYQTKAINNIHPVAKMIIGDIKQGIPSLRRNITINTDNPVVSNTTLKKELELFVELCKELGLNENEICSELLQIKKNSIMHSGLSNKRKKQYLSEIKEMTDSTQELNIR